MGMKTAQELITSIKQLFAEVQAPAPTVPVAPVQNETQTGKLSDGTEISYDKLEAGGVVTAGGTPLAAGDYTLEDGTTISVGDAGVLTAVTAVQPMETDPANPQTPASPIAQATPAAPVQAPPAPATQNYDEVLAGYESRIKTLEDLLAAQKLAEVKTGETITKQQELLTQMFELVEKIAGESTDPAPVVQKKKFSFSEVDTHNKSLNKYQAAARKLQEESQTV